MAGAVSSSLLEYVRKLALQQGLADESDQQLLERFAKTRDEAAFTALVRRHGPLVLGVCRRILRHHHDADDAFQVTFLVLARKAGAVAKPHLLANWLYGVAHRSAHKVRASIVTRQMKEIRVARADEHLTAVDIEWRDIRPVLDDEIHRLPEKYRLPFVLCHFDGKTNEAAAQLIGCPKGTVLSRLAWARERLRSRLTRRGLGLSAASLSTLIAENTSAAVPTTLINRTVESALLFAAGGMVPGSILAERVLTTMLISKIKSVATAMAILGLAMGLGGGIVHMAGAQPPKDGPPKDQAVQVDNVNVFQKVPVTTDEILSELGLNIYKFQFSVPKEEKFWIAMTTYASKEDGPKSMTRSEHTSARNEPITMTLKFLRSDRKMESALLSDSEWIEFGITIDGSYQPGYATMIANPLRSHPANKKTLFVFRSDKDVPFKQKSETMRLIVLADNTSKPTFNGDLGTIYPRAEFTVTRGPMPK